MASLTTSGSDSAARVENVLIARQPIFDRYQGLFGYELLFRDTAANQSGLNGDDVEAGDAASATTINNSLNLVGLQALTGGKKALINVTRKVVVDEIYTVLPRELVILELLETVDPDAEVIEACRKLKDAGYELALDDFVFHPRFKPLLELTDILKVDFLLSNRDQRKMMAEQFGGRMRLLAEKVETHEDVAQATRLGYTYFQGFYYCKPQLLSSRQVPAGKHNHVRFLEEVNREDASFERLESVVKQEMSLSVKLLRYLNSAAFSLRSQVTSIKHAMALMGLDQLRKWASLVAMTSIAEPRGAQLVATCLARARFCELVGATMRPAPSDMHLFLAGLLSCIDAMLGCRMTDVLAQLSLPSDVKLALLGARNRLREVLDLALAHEQADWRRVTSLSATLGVTASTIARAGHEAARWSDRVSAI